MWNNHHSESRSRGKKKKRSPRPPLAAPKARSMFSHASRWLTTCKLTQKQAEKFFFFFCNARATFHLDLSWLAGAKWDPDSCVGFAEKISVVAAASWRKMAWSVKRDVSLLYPSPPASHTCSSSASLSFQQQLRRTRPSLMNCQTETPVLREEIWIVSPFSHRPLLWFPYEPHQHPPGPARTERRPLRHKVNPVRSRTEPLTEPRRHQSCRCPLRAPTTGWRPRVTASTTSRTPPALTRPARPAPVSARWRWSRVAWAPSPTATTTISRSPPPSSPAWSTGT